MMSFIALIALPLLAPYVAAAAPVAGTTYSIHPASFPDLCVAPASDSDGAKLMVTDCDKSDDIVWTFNGVALENSATQKCIDITDGANWSGNKPQVWDCYSWNPNQMFALSGGTIQWASQNQCLDLIDGKGVEGNQLQTWTCYNGNPNQQWVFNQVQEVDGCAASNGAGTGSTMSANATAPAMTATETAPTAPTASPTEDASDETASTASAAEAAATTTMNGDDDSDDCDDETAEAGATDSASSSSSATMTASAAYASSTNGTDLGGALLAGASSSHKSHKSHKGSSNSWSASSSDDWSSSTTTDSANATATAVEDGASTNSWGSSATNSWGSSATGTQTGSAPNATSTGSSGSSSGNADMSGYIQTSGTKLVDSSGKNVVLKGTNLGGWLVWEDWMCGITDNSGSADRFPQTTLENRFGIDKTYELAKIWQDNWLVSADFDVLSGMGFNVLRVPFSYLNFVYSNGTQIYGSNGDLDYTRLDWVVSEAKKRGMYVIPTYHIWDGQEDHYSTVSEDSDDGRAQRTKMGDLWTKIAAHFAGESAIAAFDAINEPTGSANNNLQRDLYNAIRKGDPKRVIVMESISAAPDGDWTNVVYSMHEYLMMGDDEGYNKDQFNQGVKGDINTFSGVGVPSYVGEFMASDDTLTWMLSQLNNMGVSWSGWTYKTVNMDRWGLYNFGGGMSVDVSSDSFDSISGKWSNMGGTSKSRVVDQYKNAVGGSNWKRHVPETRAPQPAPVVVSPRVEEPATAIGRSRRHGGRSRRMAGVHGMAKLR